MPLCADLTPSEETGVDRALDVADVGAVTVDWYGGDVVVIGDTVV